jgi:hypothetical protein
MPVTHRPRFITSLAGLALLLAAARVAAQSAPADPLLMRLNGTQALTGTLLPVAAASVPQLHQSISRISVSEYPMKVPVIDVGIIVDSWVTDVRFDLPVDSNDVTADFLDAPAPRGRLLLSFDFDGARLSFKYHVRTRATSNVSNLVSTFTQQRMLSLDEVFTVSVSRLRGGIDVGVVRSGNAVAVSGVNGHHFQVGSVQVSDSGWLAEIANFVLGFDRLFNVVGASDANGATTRLANHILATHVNLRDVIAAHANVALGMLATQQFPQQALALPQGGLLLYNASLAGIATASGPANSLGTAVTSWNVAVDARPDGAVAGLAYSRAARPAENILQVPEQGHAQLFMPWTFLDHVAYELVQAGSLRAVPVPDPDGTGPLRAFTMHVVPTAVPRVQPVASSPDSVVISFAARMDDAVIGTVATSGTIGGQPTAVRPGPTTAVDISTVSATAGMQIQARLGAGPGASVWMSVQNVTLDGLSGQIRFGAATQSLAQYRTLLQNAINTALQQRGMNRIPLAPRAMQLAAPLSLLMGPPTAGPQYLRLPLSIITAPRMQVPTRVN